MKFTKIFVLAAAVLIQVSVLPAYVNAQDEERMISLNFQNTDIDSVLKFFSEATNSTFIKSDSVQGAVTVISQKRIPVKEAMDILQAILETKSCTMVRAGNVIKVMTQAEAVQKNVDTNVRFDAGSLGDSDRVITQILPLKYISVAEAKTDMQGLVSRTGSIIANERTNSLVITDTASNIKRLARIIETLDVRTPQIMIEALIAEVGLTDETRLGLEWSYQVNPPVDFTSNLSQNWNLATYISEGFKYSVVKNDQSIKGVLQALSTNENVNVLSTPHILASNGKEAVISVGEEIPVLKESRQYLGETTRSYEYKQVTVELSVTPRVNSENDVTMLIKPLIKKILTYDPTLNAPILATREAKTNIVVKDGQTVVIGGLIKDDEKITESKVPILGDIPLLGYAFKKHGKQKIKTELLIFITPRVVLSTTSAAVLTSQKEINSTIQNTPGKVSIEEKYREAISLYADGRYEESIALFGEIARNYAGSNYAKKSEKYIKKARKKLKG